MCIPALLSTNEVNSFAHHTVINRLPGIVKSIVQNNTLDAETIGRLEELIRGIPESPLELLPETSDVNIRINSEIRKNAYRWNKAPFIFIENYLYHLLSEIMDFKNNGKDYFSFKKNEDVISNKAAFVSYIEKFDELSASKYEEAFRNILYLNILGNKADLSQLSDLRNGKMKLLIDDTEKAAGFFQAAKRIDIVLDNSGEELFFDVLFAHFLLNKTKIEKVALHFKTIPYFVSDALKSDFYFLLQEISSNENGKNFAHAIDQYIGADKLLLCEDAFWSDTDEFRNIPEHIRILLNESDLVVFKGDLNYRKLVGDRHWDLSTKTADITDYMKKSSLIIRILKSELLTGLNADPPAGEIPGSCDKTWMYNGEYGIIQFIAACR